jgi:hypothetical protein
LPNCLGLLDFTLKSPSCLTGSVAFFSSDII